MQVQLKILDGSMRGQSFSFPLPEGEEVRLGRDAERCRVGLSADYRAVSRQHCALRSVLGRVRIRTNKENAVLVGGEPVFDDAVLADGAVLQLGHGGPRVALQVRYPAAAGSPASTISIKVDGAAPEVELRREAVQVASQLRTHRRRAWLSRAVIAGTALVGVWFAVEARADAASLRQVALDDDQRDVVLRLIERQANALPGLSEVTARISDSVYCVMRERDGAASPVGTAWVVDGPAGLLATNAHVALEFEPGATFLRANGAASQDIAVESVRAHPAYEEFGEQLGRYCRLLDMSGADSSSRSMRGYDVALLVVADESRRLLAPSLPLPSGDEIGAILPGAACATVGFPAEGIGFHPERPQQKTHLGHVVAVTDYFMAAAAAEHAQLVHTSLPVAGGASGSPVIDARGRVIGLISSANVVHSAEGRRIPLAGTTCAQRVDTLRELLDGRLHDEARRAMWQQNFDAAVANAKKSMEQILIEAFEASLRRRGAAGGVDVMRREQIRLEWDPEAGATMNTFEVAAPASCAYLCCVIADDVRDIDVTLFLPGGARKEDRSPDWYPSVAFEVEKGDSFRIATFRAGNRPTTASVLMLRERGEVR